MTIPLVVGVDGSEASLEAVDWAADEAVRHDVPLHLLHAAARDGEGADVISGASERVGAGAPTVRLSSEVLHEDAAAALVDKGRNAVALVLGSRGLGDLAGMLLGSVSLAVAARADCPVVVVRGGAEHRGSRFGNIVVGVEDGEGSGTAAQFAFREAHVRRCRLVAVHAWSVPVGTPMPPGLSGYALQALQRPPAQVLAEALHDPAERYQGVPVSSEVVEGSARRALLKAAAGADLLVVGARRRHGHIGLQLGLVNHRTAPTSAAGARTRTCGDPGAQRDRRLVIGARTGRNPGPPRSGHGDAVIEGHVLDGVQEFDALGGGTPKGFAAGDQAGASGPLVDHCRPYGLREVPLTSPP